MLQHVLNKLGQTARQACPRTHRKLQLTLQAHSTTSNGTTGSLQATPHIKHVIDSTCSMPSFEIVSERVAFQRYLSVYDRKIKVVCESTGQEQEVLYDVVGHPKCNFKSVTILPFQAAADGKEAQVTLIREYCQGPNAVCYNVPSGGFDPVKHKSLVDCAVAELSEEALLHGGELVCLVPPGHEGFYEVKWCQNKFTPFVVINPQVDPNPGDRDAEEHIQVVQVSIPELKRLVAAGELMLPSMMTVNMALTYLEGRGLL